MQLKLIVNGVDHSLWLAENGLVRSPLVRQSRSIVTLNGTEWRTDIQKHQLEASYVELRDSTLAKLKASLKASSPATVTFTDDDGNDLTRTMYWSGPRVTAKKVKGGNTYYMVHHHGAGQHGRECGGDGRSGALLAALSAGGGPGRGGQRGE